MPSQNERPRRGCWGVRARALEVETRRTCGGAGSKHTTTLREHSQAHKQNRFHDSIPSHGNLSHDSSHVLSSLVFPPCHNRVSGRSPDARCE